MKKILFIVIITAAVITLSANPYGTFSRINLSPYSTGMGEIGTVVNGQTEIMSINPATLTGIGMYQISTAYRQYYAGFHIASLGALYRVADKHVIGLQIPYMMKNSIVSYNDLGDSTGVYGYSVMTPGLYYGISINEEMSAGIGIKYLYQQLDDYSDGYVTGGIGMQYKTGGLILGLSAVDMGLPATDGTLTYDAPYSINMGAGYTVIEDINIGAQMSYGSGEGVKASLGGEYGIKDIVYLRTGYSYKQNMTSYINGLRGGLGVKAGMISVNYAVTYDNYLGLTNIVGINISN